MITRLVAPDAATLNRFAKIHATAFAPGARGWSSVEIRTLAQDCALFASPSGFALTRTVLDETELLTIAVDPSAQRSGEGRALMAHVLAIHKNMMMFLEVAADNAAALSLYASCGFEVMGRRKGYYQRADGSSVDALTMRRAPH